MKLARVAGLLTLLLLYSACINHPIVKDYPDYLDAHMGTVSLTPLSPEAGYVLTERTRDHQLTFKWMATGAAHRWIVDFGQMLELTLQSDDYATSFHPANEDDRLKITFDLIDYRFRNGESQVELRADVVLDGEIIFGKLYSATGSNQKNRVRWSGVFGAKNAITASTKFAIDSILRELREDLDMEGIAANDRSEAFTTSWVGRGQ